MESNLLMCPNCSSNPIDLHEHLPCCGSLICSTCSRSGSCKLNLNSSITISCKVCGLPSSKDGNQLIERLLVRAQEGLAWAQADAGEYYFVSRGEAGTPEFVSKIASALRCFSLAATQGNLKAQYYLGLCFLNGIGLDTHALQGLKLIQIAASKGYKVAQDHFFSSCATSVTNDLNIYAQPIQSSTFNTSTPFQNTNININNTMIDNNFYNNYMKQQYSAQIAMNPNMMMAMPFVNQNLGSIGSGALPCSTFPVDNSFSPFPTSADNMNNNSTKFFNPNFVDMQMSIFGGDYGMNQYNMSNNINDNSNNFNMSCGYGMNPYMNNNVNNSNTYFNNAGSESAYNLSSSSYVPFAPTNFNPRIDDVSTNYNMKIKARSSPSVCTSDKLSDLVPSVRMNDNLSLLGIAVETLEKKLKRKRADDEDYKIEAYNSDASNNSDYSPLLSSNSHKRKVPSQYKPRQVQNALLAELDATIDKHNENSNETPFLSYLKRLVSASGSKFNRIPVVGGILLDLETLFVLVQQHGGMEKVTRALMWRSLAARMSIPSACTSAGHLLRKYYTSLLLPHEEELIKFMMRRDPQLQTEMNIVPTFIEMFQGENNLVSHNNINNNNNNNNNNIDKAPFDFLNNPMHSSFMASTDCATTASMTNRIQEEMIVSEI